MSGALLNTLFQICLLALTRFGLLGLQLALSNGCTYKSSFWIFCLFHFMGEYSAHKLKIEFG